MNPIRRFVAGSWKSVSNFRLLLLFIFLYLLLLASLYIFVSTREATILQVLISLVFMVLIPAEFFVLQSSILARAHDRGWEWHTILIDAVKLFIATIPILIVGYVIWTLLNKWQLRYQAPRPPIVFPPSSAKPQPLHWPSLLFATARGLLFVVLLPLATIHLWIEVASRDIRLLFSGGAGAIFRRFGRAMSRAFASSSVFIYALGLVLFALIPYGFLVVRISPKGTKTDFAVFILRLLLVFLFTLIGWVVTLVALATNSTTAPEARKEIIPTTVAESPSLV